mmetsp:Transcript_15790/g.36224  ORF Transcript_15790/g.36224 Transcript_15790/m.36224 type:complete len:366 (-) Transcript_15790:39-1136(-)
MLLLLLRLLAVGGGGKLDIVAPSCPGPGLPSRCIVPTWELRRQCCPTPCQIVSVGWWSKCRRRRRPYGHCHSVVVVVVVVIENARVGGGVNHFGIANGRRFGQEGVDGIIGGSRGLFGRLIQHAFQTCCCPCAVVVVVVLLLRIPQQVEGGSLHRNDTAILRIIRTESVQIERTRVPSVQLGRTLETHRCPFHGQHSQGLVSNRHFGWGIRFVVVGGGGGSSTRFSSRRFGPPQHHAGRAILDGVVFVDSPSCSVTTLRSVLLLPGFQKSPKFVIFFLASIGGFFLDCLNGKGNTGSSADAFAGNLRSRVVDGILMNELHGAIRTELHHFGHFAIFLMVMTQRITTRRHNEEEAQRECCSSCRLQ